MIRQMRVTIVLSLVLSMLCLSRAAEAQAAQVEAGQEPELRLDEVVVSASRLADAIQALRRVPGQVYVVTAEEIERTHSRGVQEALRQVPGIVFYDQVGNGFQQQVDLRGFSGQPNPSVSVFVDGVRVNDPDTNAVNFDLIPIQDVERIEVLPGATAVYGQNAVSGVINIITKRGGKKPQTTVEGALGSYHHYRVSANTSGPIGAFDYYAGAVWDRESGYRESSDGRVSRVTGRIGYRHGEATDLSLAYGYVNDRLEQAGTLPLAALQQDRRQSLTPSLYANELSSVTFQGRQRLGGGFSVSTNGYYRQTSREGISVSPTFYFRGITDTDTTGGTMQLSHEAQLWGRTNRFVAGGELQHSHVNTSSGSTFGPSARLIDQNMAAGYAQDTFDLTPEIVLTAAVRYDSSRVEFEDELAPLNDGRRAYYRLTPRAGVTYTPWSALSFYVNYGQGFRVPTTDELFAFVGSSNPDLKPVKSETYEVGLRARPLGWLEATAALFLTNVKDEIEYVPDPATCFFCGQNQNAPRTRRQGVEATARIRPHAQVDLLVGYSYTEARYRSQWLSAFGLVEKGDWAPLVPMHRANASLNYRPLEGLELGLDGVYVSRQVLLNDQPNQVGFRVQDYVVMNARAAYTWKALTAFLRLNNLTGNKYQTYGVVGGFAPGFTSNYTPAPGFNVLGGVTVKLEDYY